ncbi:uncharacterized protein LOC134292259, partial [Aedes albopictus]|uniref:Secreted protein n=1 Tax=Aedes albopictus TaxID=7160 RepID=A0ABM1YH18_AEDAL
KHILNSIRYLQAKYIFDVSPLTECDNGEPYIAMDMSNFNIVNQEDGGLFYNGSITYREAYRSPWKIKLSSKHLQRGTWQPGIVNKEMDDFCTAIRNPMERFLYKTYEKLEKHCPFEAGYQQNIDMLSIGSFGVIIPPSFAGDWKFYVNMWVPRDGRLDHECFIFPATVYEV